MRISKPMAVTLLLGTVVIFFIGLYLNYLQLTVAVIATISAIAAIAKLYPSGPKIRLHLENPKQAIPYTGGDPYDGWRIPFTFVNEGERTGRVFDSFAKVVMNLDFSNTQAERVPLGPDGSDFMIDPDRPIKGQISLGVRPRTPEPSWERDYVEAAKRGELRVAIQIEYKYGDPRKRFAKGAKLTLQAPLFSSEVGR